MTTRKPWTRDELLVVLNLYHKLTFGQFHHRQPAIIVLAEKLGRTADSIAMKLSNLASCDPVLQLRGKKGLSGASNLDRTTWNEFHENLNETIPASEEALRELFETKPSEELEISPQVGIKKQIFQQTRITETETTAQVRLRRGQSFFRNAVLNNYGENCGITKLALRELLVASHILPWSTHPQHRLEIQNGICLSRLHDAAFDCGLISFDDNLHLLISNRLKTALPKEIVETNFLVYEGLPLNIPRERKTILPSPAYLAEHRKTIFRNTV